MPNDTESTVTPTPAPTPVASSPAPAPPSAPLGPGAKRKAERARARKPVPRKGKPDDLSPTKVKAVCDLAMRELPYHQAFRADGKTPVHQDHFDGHRLVQEAGHVSQGEVIVVPKCIADGLGHRWELV